MNNIKFLSLLCEPAKQECLRESWVFNTLEVALRLMWAENWNKELSCSNVIMFINKYAVSHVSYAEV